MTFIKPETSLLITKDKSIEELKRQGWRITPAKKGADSIKNSIDILKRYKINVTRNSVNLRNELNRYKWRADATGKIVYSNEYKNTVNKTVEINLSSEEPGVYSVRFRCTRPGHMADR